jgi:hypothetical protein
MVENNDFYPHNVIYKSNKTNKLNLYSWTSQVRFTIASKADVKFKIEQPCLNWHWVIFLITYNL